MAMNRTAAISELPMTLRAAADDDSPPRRAAANNELPTTPANDKLPMTTTVCCQ